MKDTAFAQAYRKYAFGLLVAVALVASAAMILPFLPALMWAIVLTVLMRPFHCRFCRKRSPNAGAAITTFAAIGIVFIPLMLVGLVLFTELSQYAAALQQQSTPGKPWTPDTIVSILDDNVKPIAEKLGNPDFSVKEWFDQNRTSLSRTLGQSFSKGAQQAGYAVFTLVVAFLTMFFLVRDGEKLREPALELIPLKREKAEYILDRMGQTIHAVFVGVVMVALVQGTLAGIAYWALGVPSPIVWMVVTIVLCAVPLLGAPLVYVPLSLLLIAQGHVWQGIVLAVIGFGIVSNVDNILRPFIIGSRVNLHPMAIFFSLLGGVFALGPVGIMAGPVLLTVVLALQDVVRGRLEEAEAIEAD